MEPEGGRVGKDATGTVGTSRGRGVTWVNGEAVASLPWCSGGKGGGGKGGEFTIRSFVRSFKQHLLAGRFAVGGLVGREGETPELSPGGGGGVGPED